MVSNSATPFRPAYLYLADVTFSIPSAVDLDLMRPRFKGSNWLETVKR